VAVDDFGTGYSSLSQLTRMPVSVLKIDRAFVDGIDKSEENRTVIRAVIGLGRSLGLKLVAEGVETGAQLRELCAYGCDLIQGYFFHRPLEEAVFIDTVNRQPPDLVPGSLPLLHFLIYVSRATRPISPAELAALIKHSQASNRAAGISGCLVYRDGYFMQMVEGQREALFALKDKIKRDTRHCDFKLVMEGATRRRMFRDWGMALRDLSHDADAPVFAPLHQPRHEINFMTLGDDPRASYDYITAYALRG
jgi:hypothetical protein